MGRHQRAQQQQVEKTRRPSDDGRYLNDDGRDNRVCEKATDVDSKVGAHIINETGRTAQMAPIPHRVVPRTNDLALVALDAATTELVVVFLIVVIVFLRQAKQMGRDGILVAVLVDHVVGKGHGILDKGLMFRVECANVDTRHLGLDRNGGQGANVIVIVVFIVNNAMDRQRSFRRDRLLDEPGGLDKVLLLG